MKETPLDLISTTSAPVLELSGVVKISELESVFLKDTGELQTATMPETYEVPYNLIVLWLILVSSAYPFN